METRLAFVKAMELNMLTNGSSADTVVTVKKVICLIMVISIDV